MILQSEPAKGGKIALYLDGEYRMTVDPDTWYSLSFTDGCEIGDDEWQEIEFTVSSRQAYAQALRFLTLRAHSAEELYQKLLKKHSPACASFAVERCRELGFIDDVDFASRYALELAERKHYGPSRIRQELYAKGISRELIDETVSHLEFDYAQSVRDTVEKKYRDCLDNEKGRRKMTAGLMRLGFTYADIKTALADYEIPEDGTDEY